MRLLWGAGDNLMNRQAKCLPFMGKTGRPAIGLKPLSLEDWLDIDEEFERQLRHKSGLLDHRYDDVFVALPDTQAAQKEVLELLSDHLVTHFPEIYHSVNEGIHNLQTQQTWSFTEFAESPLNLAGRLVQEDLCILLPGETGYVLSAASVCFPLRWRLREKLGQPLGQIHQRVPDYGNRLERPVDNVFARLRQGFPGLRFNWSIVDSPELFLDQEKLATGFNGAIAPNNAGQRLWLRVERQTLRRLPISGGVLFTIRTYVDPLDQIATDPEVAAQLFHAVQSLQPEMQVYKNLLPFREALLTYLDRCAVSITKR
ncbi:MAG: DUF3445 domain-containing protein [Cyanobacteria bacterium P01_H01_bin.21]